MENMKKGFRGLLVLFVFTFVLAFQAQADVAQTEEKNLSGVEKLACSQLEELKAANGKSIRNLKKAFKWAASLQYYEDSSFAKKMKLKKAVEFYGTYGFNMKKGDCNVEAFTFYWMAKMMGYDAVPVQGYILKGDLSPHSWVTIKIGRKEYVFDPNFSKEYGGKMAKTKSGKTVKLNKLCGFKLTYSPMKNHPHLQYYSKKKKLLGNWK